MPERFAEVAVFSALDKTLHYRIPSSLQPGARPGCRVLAPLRRRQVLGLILDLQQTPPKLQGGVKMRSIIALLDASPVLPAELLKLCRWVAGYYCYPLGEVVRTVLPAGAQTVPELCFRPAREGREAAMEGVSRELLPFFQRGSASPVKKVLAGFPSEQRKKLHKELSRLEKKGWIERTYRWKAPKNLHGGTVKQVRLTSGAEGARIKDNPNLLKLVELLEAAGGPLPVRDIRRQVRNVDYWVAKLQNEGHVAVEETGWIDDFASSNPPPPHSGPHVLTQDQSRVFETVLSAVSSPTFEAFLLQGVPGSGKTEIYLQLAERVVKEGRGVLVLVPEIALSTQLEALFRQRFGPRLAVWHSGLPAGTRHEQWKGILDGEKRVALGVRSAVFMPVSRLGLVIVDEEHDASYKQEDHLRYHARDVAIMRASMLGVPVVLGSATPSLQSVHNAVNARYMRLSLPHRVFERPLPALEVVDMRREKGENRILSHALRNRLREALDEGRQALLFLNRRGFATFLLCNVCGHVVQCGRCSVSLTYHQRDHALRCHYCGVLKRVPEACPQCGHASLVSHGFGTERVEEEVARFAPDARIVRIDRDTVSRSRQMTEALSAIRRHEADILVGTQMIAKGHDFPNVTLVGVVNADTSLQMADFRAGESTVQLLMQVSGRAGRGEIPGRVVIQTYNPSHYTIQSVLNMSYDDFCSRELSSREVLQYPPYTRMLKILITSPDEKGTYEAAQNVAGVCRRLAEELRERKRFVAVMGPAPAPVMKLKDRFRWHIYVKAWTNSALQELMEAVVEETKELPLPRKTQLAVDRDPVSSF